MKKFFLLLTGLLVLTLLLCRDVDAGGFRGGFRSSGSSFRSSSSRSSFSSRPSRTFTYRSSASTSRSSGFRPSYSTTRSAAAYRPTYRSARPTSRTTIVNNHHYSGGGGYHSSGPGLMDYLMLDAIVNRPHHQTVVQAAPVDGVYVQPEPPLASQPVYVEESHFWRNFFLLVLLAGLGYGVYRYVTRPKPKTRMSPYSY